MPFKPLQKKSQNDLLRDHFKKRDSISGLEAQALYRIRALPRRIKDLEEQDHADFAREPKTDPTGQRYVRYVKLPQNQGTAFADR